MSGMHTPQESEFLKYFRRINKRSIDNILTGYRSTGPVGYASSLVLARILTILLCFREAESNETDFKT